MTGEYKIRVRNSRNNYIFALRRNITVLCGDSGRGKTTLFDMISDYNRSGKSSGVSVSCDKELIALDSRNWQDNLERIKDSIVVIDEDSKFVKSRDFARAVRNSDNYYLLITRNYLSTLPYSVDEIYELSGAKNKKFKPVYIETDKMYDRPAKGILPFEPELIITEDSRAGYQFFRNEADKMGIPCVSAEGKSNIFTTLTQYSGIDVVIIADGAAFGSEIRDIVEQQKIATNKIAIYLPESFEWLILLSGAVSGIDKKYLESPQQYADSKLYMSWEQYFTALLIEATKGDKHRSYSKDKLADHYKTDRISKLIKDEIKGIRLEKD